MENEVESRAESVPKQTWPLFNDKHRSYDGSRRNLPREARQMNIVSSFSFLFFFCPITLFKT